MVHDSGTHLVCAGTALARPPPGALGDSRCSGTRLRGRCGLKCQEGTLLPDPLIAFIDWSGVVVKFNIWRAEAGGLSLGVILSPPPKK